MRCTYSCRKSDDLFYHYLVYLFRLLTNHLGFAGKASVRAPKVSEQALMPPIQTVRDRPEAPKRRKQPPHLDSRKPLCITERSFFRHSRLCFRVFRPSSDAVLGSGALPYLASA